MARVWITRAQPGAQATAGRVRALGHAAVVAPLLAVHATSAGPLDLSGVGALAFTSANGVMAFAGRSGRRDLPVFAVGSATALAAREAGFAQVAASEGGVTALAALIQARRGEITGAVLHPGAAVLAGDLVGLLQAAGLPARRLAVYETRPRRLAPAEIAALAELEVVLIHSARAAEVLAEVLAAHPAPQLRALGISPAALAPLAATTLAGKVAPPQPCEAALIRLIEPRP